MKILITGVEGYIGSLLAPILIQRGHDVRGTDTGYYRDGWLYSDSGEFQEFPHFLNKDLRNIEASDLEGCEAVVHLAELSNDPLGQNNPENTYKINHEGSVRLATLAKSVGVERFVYTSSCSVYGAGAGEFLDETAKTNPQTAYADCKVKVEKDVGLIADDSFSPVFLRNATAYGPSPRMRFDIVLNNLTGWAHTTKRIAMTSDGTPWRPLVHVLDICNAIVSAVEAPREAVHNEVFNVGRNEDNFRIREIAEVVADVFPGCELSIGDSSGDNRSYRVNFDKITSALPGFSGQWDIESGAKKLREVFERIDMDNAMFSFRAFTRLQQLKYLIRTSQIDAKFFWRY
jgi:nucleoside-diphosphate-sugar epimerase